MTEPPVKKSGSVTQSIKNLPPTAKWIGGGLLLGVLYVFYKRYKSAAGANASTATDTGPLTGGYSGGGGGSFGGSSGSDIGAMPTLDKGAPVSIPQGETLTPLPSGSVPAPSPVNANTPAALLPPMLKPFIGNPGVNAAVPVSNPVPGDTSTVVAGLLGGNPFSYGGSSSEATNLLNQLPAQPVLNMPPSFAPAPAGMVASPIMAQGKVIGVHYDPAP